MKKLISLFIILLSLLTLSPFTACKERTGLEVYVSELRSDVFWGQTDTLTIKGGYGFCETPYNNDAKVSEKVHTLTLKLMNKETSQTTYSASLDFNGEKYACAFKLNPVTHSLIATFEIENFNLKEFDVNISAGDQTQTVRLKSLLPENTLSYEKALSCLEKSQPQLIKSFSDSDGNFCAEIYMRIIVKKEKAYWYVGIASGNDQLKALLIDGATGEVLAIREII